MTRAARLVLSVLILAAPALGGCVVAAVGGAAVGVTAAAVGATVKVASTAVGATADVAGGAVRTVTGGGKKGQR